MATIFGNRIVDDAIVFHIDFANRKCFAPNILNYSHWTVGSGTVAQDITRYGTTQYTQNGLTAENARVLGTDPFGYSKATVWRAQNSDSTDDADGGWDTGRFSIDKSRLYRFTVWTKRDQMTVGGSQSGSLYFGHMPYNENATGIDSIRKYDGVPFHNPYFHVTPNTTTSILTDVQAPFLGGLNAWTLVVGHVWPVGSGTAANLPGTNINGLPSNTEHPDSGVWTRPGGKIGNLFSYGYGGDFVWLANTATSTHRAYLYYSMDLTSRQSFIYPRVDLVDGNEPKINELLAGPEPIRDLSRNQNVIYPLSTTNFDTEGRGLNFGGIEQNVLRGTMSATFSAQTVSVWLNPTLTVGSQSGSQNLLQFGPTSSANWLVVGLGNYSGATDGEIVSVITDYMAVGGTQSYSAHTSNSFTLQAGVWHNLVLSWSGTKYLMYINGSEVTTVAGGGNYGGRHAALAANVNVVHIGSASITSDGISYPYNSHFNGKIGSVVIYERSLTSTEVISNYQQMRRKYS